MIPKGARQHSKFIKYYITNDGKVWSTISNRFLKPGLSCGRLTVSLGRNETELVHRLVLGAFVGLCPEGMECCHADDNPLNNNLSNLRWDTRSNNMKEGYRNGKYKRLVGEKGYNAKLKEGDVRFIIYLLTTKVLKRKEIAEYFGVSPYTIDGIRKKQNWKHIWSS